MRAELMMIPSDIIPEILCRLPSKSIGRFRSVSKGWLCLLTNPKFIKTHGKTLNRNHHIFADEEDGLLYSHPFDDHDPIIILNPSNELPIGLFEDFRGSCDGLVLVSQRQHTNKYFDTVVLLNPTTREFVRLPQPVSYDPHREYVCITHGVGYHIVTDDYKVITLTYFDMERVWTKMRLSIYSLISNTWRHHPVTDSPDYNCSDSPPAVYAHGFIHWIGWNKNGLRVVVAFSLVDECFSEVPSPDLCNDTNIMYREPPRLVLFDGKLDVYKNPDPRWIGTGFELWLMNEYGVKESWNKIPLDILI